MAKEHAKLEIVNENNKSTGKNIEEEIEMIFGKPNSAKDHVINNVPLIDSERRHDKKHNGIGNIGESDSEHPMQPLLEPDRGRQKPPLAGPEIDDLDGDPPTDAAPYPGIDDGLLETNDKKPEVHDNDDGETGVAGSEGEPTAHSDRGDAGTDDINGLSPRFNPDDRPVSPVPGVIPDVNTYQQKKNLAQGMMDLALLSANANQLRYVLESSTAHPYYYSSLVFISLSILFQVMVGVGLIMNSRYDVNDHKEICKADKINNMTVLGIFLITIVNVFITSFSVATPTINGAVGVPQQAG